MMTPILYCLLGLVIFVGSHPIKCPPKDDVCEKDKLGFEAIKTLHLQMDDDNDGNLDREESDEFMRDELKYEDGFDRQVNFHGKDDLITINDLWTLWIGSEVYNWTTDETLDWLVTNVELPQYDESFKINAVDGHVLPRIAANGQYNTNILGIKNGVHRQKLSLKAMDLVLFGPPKKGHNYIKDLALVASLVIAVGGCWMAYVQNKYSQSHLKKVMKDLDNLQKAEDALTQLQSKLQEAQQEQESVVEEKKHLEREMKGEITHAKNEAEKLRTQRETTQEEISRLKLAEAELTQVRRALKKAEKEMEEIHNAPLAELQQWLQYTYELENKHYSYKKEAAERQLLIAKEMCEKIRKKRGAFMGSFRIAHTTSMDDTDHKIMNARSALEEFKLDLQERSHRWQEMEKICGFNIKTNPGLLYLETVLRTSGGHPYAGGSSALLNNQHGSSVMLNAEGEADEDCPPGYYTAAGMLPVGLMPEKRSTTTLAKAFGSSQSLSVNPPQGQKAGLVSPDNTVTRSHTMSTMQHIQASDAENVTGSDESLESPVRHSHNGVSDVRFDLGENRTENDTSSLGEDDNATGDNTHSLKKSQSLDEQARRLPRPKTLPSALSESALTVKPVQTTTPVRRSVNNNIPIITTTPTLDEEHSGQESTDSGQLEEEKKKKKKRLLPKLLRKETKTKAS